MILAVGWSLGVVAYLALFTAGGLAFIFINLLVGRFLRAHDPHPEKQEIYECGEPTIGTSFVQFDIRFYVVALLFIIFDVEIAFFFPWATVFGKSAHLANDRGAVVATVDGQLVLTPETAALYRELGVRQPQVPTNVPASLRQPFQAQFGAEANAAAVDAGETATFVARRGARQLVWFTIFDIGVFFAVLLVGFAYVWKRGDLDWVRAVGSPRVESERPPPSARPARESVLSA
jgi:NADH-quinone oxidoreductase subunit A